jgi:hypothetical protein
MAYMGFRNRYNDRPRIDARPRNDEATQAGMRGVHRGMGGEVIGGYTAEGQALGTKATKGAAAGIGGMKTPGLDRQAAMQQGSKFRRSFADQEKDARAKSAASGAFGKEAQQLEGRRSLYKDMTAAGSGAITPQMEQRAGDLGVKRSRFREVAGGIPAAPAMIARPAAPARPSMMTAEPPVQFPTANKAFPVGAPAPRKSAAASRRNSPWRIA